MKKIETLETVAEIIVGLGVSIIVGNVVGATTPMSSSKINKALIVIGTFVLGGMMADKAGKYTKEFIDTNVKEAMKVINEEEVTA